MTRDNETDSQSEMIEHEEHLESVTSKLDAILLDKLEAAFHQQTSTVIYHDLAKIACEYSPVDLAYAAPKLPSHARAVLYENLSDIEAKTSFMVNTDSSTRLAVFREISDEEIKTLISHMSSDDAVFVMEVLSEKRYRRIIEKIDPKKAQRIKEIKKYARNTAGRLMINEFFSFVMDVTLGQVASHIRNNPGIDLTRRIFVVDKQGVLIGYVPARNLIINPPTLTLKQVMKPVLYKVTADTSREDVVDLVERYKISALTVVNEDDKLIGVITYEDILEAIEDIADATIASFAGTAEKLRDNKPFWLRFYARAPWLFVTLIAGIISSSVMASFQKYEGGMLTFVLCFIPLITGMSGNIGIQSSTILVRGMATGIVISGTRREAILKELVVGLCAALVFGLICAFAVSFLNIFSANEDVLNPHQLGLMVGVGLFGACLTGSLLGVGSPLLFSRIGVDPAVASGPIVTAFNDVLSTVIFFIIVIVMKGFF
jgi:magnesium transporter